MEERLIEETAIWYATCFTSKFSSSLQSIGQASSMDFQASQFMKNTSTQCTTYSSQQSQSFGLQWWTMNTKSKHSLKTLNFMKLELKIYAFQNTCSFVGWCMDYLMELLFSSFAFFHMNGKEDLIGLKVTLRIQVLWSLQTLKCWTQRVITQEWKFSYVWDRSFSSYLSALCSITLNQMIFMEYCKSKLVHENFGSDWLLCVLLLLILMLDLVIFRKSIESKLLMWLLDWKTR